VIADPPRRWVALEGAVQTHEQRRDTERVVAGLPWVASVENRLHVVAES
jgi:osmotically-inducible protein OsmY